MKRLLTILLVLFSVLSIKAQSHLTFMGIPITGNINTFAQKLSAKGIRVSSLNKSANPPSSRIFEGKWNGQKAIIEVEYFGTNKTVCNITVIIKGYDKDALDFFQSSVEFDIIDKYENRYEYEETKRTGNQDVTIYHIFKSVTDKTEIGSISTYIVDNLDPNALIFLYIDKENQYLKNKQRNNDI